MSLEEPLEKKIIPSHVSKILFENFSSFFFLNFALLVLYTAFTERNRGSQYFVLNLSWTLFLLLPFGIIYFDFRKFHYGKLLTICSLFYNLLLFYISALQIYSIYNMHELYWSDSSGAILLWYIFITLLLILFIYRIEFKSFTKKIFRKINLFTYALDEASVRSLSNNYRAIYFAKKFIILQSNSIKKSLPGLLPSTIPFSLKATFEADIDRMEQLFKYNHISVYSKGAILKFVMKTADPIIKDLQLTLEQHLTEELLKENNNSKNLQINIDNLWQKVEKIMVQWESTFSNSEMEYRDILLHK